MKKLTRKDFLKVSGMGLGAVSLAMLTGCGSSSESSSSSNASESEATTEATSESAGEESTLTGLAALPPSDVYKGEVQQQTFPLVDEKVTLRVWYPYASNIGSFPDLNDGEFWQWYEELTNVHIDFIIPASGSEADSFNLLFASNDMPDIVIQTVGNYGYRNGQDAAIDDGYFADIAQYLDYAPNYVSWLNSDETFARAAYSDTGKLYGLWGVWATDSDTSYANCGMSIREDYLDALGMDVPTTYDEWEEMLIAFRDELGIEIPFYTSKYGIDNGEFMAGYDTAPYFYRRDEVVQYGPLDDSYKEYLELLHNWWEEGLLDKDFSTRSSTGVGGDYDVLLNDQVGSLIDFDTHLGSIYLSRGATNEDFYLIGAPQPKKSADSVDPAWRWTNVGSESMYGITHLVAADSENLEVAIRWLDGFYGDDVCQNANYGLESEEGIVWYADEEDGHRIKSYEFRYNNPDGLDSSVAKVKYYVHNPPVRLEAAECEYLGEASQNADEVWRTYEATNALPQRLTMTAEEGTRYATLYADIETYVQECNVKFIMGQMSLDDYDSYRETLIEMGIEECIELQQAALDRYNAR
ncbi:MAG: hypothetical protein LUG61_09730 [Lachnospiraceae bacterium]|nr:hypothetical protein [Lachnospiraceae bacterium]